MEVTHKYHTVKLTLSETQAKLIAKYCERYGTKAATIGKQLLMNEVIGRGN